MSIKPVPLSRRELLRLGVLGAAATVIGSRDSVPSDPKYVAHVAEEKTKAAELAKIAAAEAAKQAEIATEERKRIAQEHERDRQYVIKKFKEEFAKAGIQPETFPIKSIRIPVSQSTSEWASRGSVGLHFENVLTSTRVTMRIVQGIDNVPPKNPPDKTLVIRILNRADGDVVYRGWGREAEVSQSPLSKVVSQPETLPEGDRNANVITMVQEMGLDPARELSRGGYTVYLWEKPALGLRLKYEDLIPKAIINVPNYPLAPKIDKFIP